MSFVLWSSFFFFNRSRFFLFFIIFYFFFVMTSFFLVFFGRFFFFVFFFSCSFFLFCGGCFFFSIIIFFLLFFIMTSDISRSFSTRILIMFGSMRLWKFFKVFASHNVPLELRVVFEFSFDNSVMASTKLNRMLCNFVIPRFNFLIISKYLIFQTSRLK